MATERFEVEVEQPKSRARGCLIGCLVVLGITVLLLALAAFWISRNWRSWVSSAATQVIEETIQATELSAQEKSELMEQVNRLADAFRERQISSEQLGRVLDALVQSPLLPAMAVSAAERIYLTPSGLSDEEKEEARLTLQRFLRGLIDESIDEQALDTVMIHIADRQPDGQWRLREQVSDEELRAFVAAAKDQADQAGVPEEVEEVDPSDELRRIIDEAMAPAEGQEEP